jgi:hypothetical protein
MSMRKIVVLTFVCLAFTVSVAFAQGAAPTAPAKAAVSEKKTCPPYDDAKMKGDPAPIVDAIDKNKDGKMNKDEWLAAGAPIESFNSFIGKSKKDFVTREEFMTETPPNGVDANCDGKFTIEEFHNFGLQGPPGGAPGGGAPGGAPAGAPPAGGAPGGAPPAGAPQK